MTPSFLHDDRFWGVVNESTRERVIAEWGYVMCDVVNFMFQSEYSSTSTVRYITWSIFASNPDRATNVSAGWTLHSQVVVYSTMIKFDLFRADKR